ncbi:AroM family protein [Candidatus Bipolaricaulota bacterium]|nr:AroM family protein [Candidatus Bipolaricaulota bacterium]MCK4598585.1 AroM family protein [Candidatus Bipolaricaulota bacterium]
MRTIGVVTIGQSPRSDVVPELERIIKDSQTSQTVTFLQKGALDGLTADEIADLRPKEEKNHLVTKLQDGTEVAVDKHAIYPRVQQAIFDLNSKGADIITLLCSGEFPPFRSETPLIQPAKLLSGVLSSISIEGHLGVMVPSDEQVDVATEAYHRLGFQPIAVGASPYGGGDAIINAANRLKGEVALVVMDCFGYNKEMKDEVQKITRTPVILVRSLLAWTLNECLQ